MADEQTPKKSLISKLGAATKAATKLLLSEVDVSTNRMGVASTFDADYVGIEMIMGNADRPARARSEIYLKWHHMVQDGLISTILRLHVQMALGGHETTGETIFIEPKANITPADAKIVDELKAVCAMLNKSAHSTCFNAVTFGDAYARVYVKPKVGLVHLDTEQLFPPLVQAYEEAGRTVGCVASLGPKMTTQFSHLKVVRMKMPRMVFLPQMRAVENAQKMNLEVDDPRQMVPLPALVGGSFLEAMEEDYDNLVAALRGMIGQRITGSIDETMIGANMSDMTVEQQETFMRSLEKMLKSMKDRAENAVKNGTYATSRNFHIMPTFNEKQLTQISSFTGSSNSGAGAGIEDVMFCARKLAGTGGIDLSMVGFADQLTGGLGEGGYNRTSSQAAERSRIVRTAYMAYANDIIDRHMLAKYGFCWDDSERPYNVNFFGSIAALEAEKQASRERSMNTIAILVQVMAQMRDLGMDEDANKLMLLMAELDEEQAKTLAKALKNAKPPQPEGGGMIMGPDGQPVETSEPEAAMTQDDNDNEAA